MFGNLGTHVMQFPSKRWGFRGTLPVSLGSIVPADFHDVLGCRAWRDDLGALVAPKFPVFDTEAEARAHAAACGVTLAN